MAKKSEIYIDINLQKSHIEYQYATYYRIEKNGMYTFYVPGYNMFCSAKTKEHGLNRADNMVESFFVDFFEKEKSFRKFVLELHQLGFRSSHYHDLTINRLLTKKINNAQLGYRNGHASEEFKNSISEIRKGNLALAV